MKAIVRLLVVCLTASITLGDDLGNYQVGVGIADVTGPSADIGMMGYASATQTAAGIHIRLFARAFIFQSGDERVVYVSSDIGMVDQAIKTEVVRILEEKNLGDIYHAKNVLLSGTHTHSGPAGYIQYLLYGITSLGFNHQNFRAIVDGIVESIEKAHANMQPGKLFFSKGELLDANINRSPTSYLANPLEERVKYEHDADKDMSLLRIEDAAGNPLGLINWFAVHPTSMQNTNTYISGDNKGYASQLFESKMNPTARPGKGSFVAAFGSSNLGDVSPNTWGAKCVYPGLVWNKWEDLEDCEAESSTCCGEIGCFTQRCMAVGPGDKDMEESTRIIGERQFQKAEELFQDAEGAEQIMGAVQFQHQYVKMDEYMVEVADPETGIKEEKKLCKAALGFSFAGGTTDGPGAFNFQQGDTNETHPFWDIVKQFIAKPSEELLACQSPKPILLAVGEVSFPYEWVPSIVETQIIRVGNLYIIAVPGELTTMAGRRLVDVIEKMLLANDPDSNPKVVIAGLSNVYTHYIATFEEYQKQRYEAASTIYGPHTLDAYLKQYPILLESMLVGEHVNEGPAPPNLLDKQFTLVPPIVADTTPLLHAFGDVLEAPPAQITAGELLKVQFVAGHPKNDAMRGGTFFLIEKMNDGTSRWENVRTDGDWDTKFIWSRPEVGSTQSIVDVSWKIPTDTPGGIYRIRHFGYYKPYNELPKPYQGSTETFQIVPTTATKPKEHPMWNPKPQQPKKIRTTRQLWNTLGAKNEA